MRSLKWTSAAIGLLALLVLGAIGVEVEPRTIASR